jgi:hypothetical protein
MSMFRFFPGRIGEHSLRCICSSQPIYNSKFPLRHSACGFVPRDYAAISAFPQEIDVKGSIYKLPFLKASKRPKSQFINNKPILRGHVDIHREFRCLWSCKHRHLLLSLELKFMSRVDLIVMGKPESRDRALEQPA